MDRSWLRKAAWGVYARAPNLSESSLCFWRSHEAVYRRRSVPVSVLRGPSRAEGGGSATVLSVGKSNHLEYLVERLFAQEPVREELGQHAWGTLGRQIESWRGKVDLTIGHVPRRASAKMAGSEGVEVPEWMTRHTPVPADIAEFRKGSKSVTDDLRLIRKHGLTTEHTAGMGELDQFYEPMHRPLIRSRYGDTAFTFSYNKLEAFCRRDGLIWILRDGVRIAGMVYHRTGRRMKLLALGTLDGDYAHAKAGAIAALYLGSFAQARELGCTVVDLGGVRASMSDGLYRFKRKWGGVIAPSHVCPFGFVLHWARWNSVVADFVKRLAPLSLTAGAFHGVCVLGENETASESHHNHWTGGMRRLYLINTTGKPVMETPASTTVIEASEGLSSAALRKHFAATCGNQS